MDLEILVIPIIVLNQDYKNYDRAIQIIPSRKAGVFMRENREILEEF